MTNIVKNIHTINHLIDDYTSKYGRAADAVRLLLASKGQSIEKIKIALSAGQFIFGESYLQEALAKMARIADESAKIEWHFIGKLQSNKCKKISENFAWVHTIDSLKVAKRLSDHRLQSMPPLNCCIEVNISHETSKSGVNRDQLLKLAEYCVSLSGLKLRGLMCIPAPTNDFDQQRRNFQQLRSLFEKLKVQGFMLDTLSMGMSFDFEAAIAEGSTCVRIGTAVFGPRLSYKK